MFDIFDRLWPDDDNDDVDDDHGYHENNDDDVGNFLQCLPC